ncbi:MAG: hypothetical protein AAF607_02760 [Pseudomonadota bacterium]
MKSVFLKSIRCVAVIGLCAASVTTANSADAAEQCLSSAEATAEKIRRLKTTLMVGALQCDRATHLRVAESYNAFVETHGTAIQAYDNTLSQYFERVHGGNARKMMDRHVTSLANKVATQSYRTTDFCEQVAALASASLTDAPETLLAVADQNMIAPARLKSCDTSLQKAAQALPLAEK